MDNINYISVTRINTVPEGTGKVMAVVMGVSCVTTVDIYARRFYDEVQIQVVLLTVYSEKR